jgi:hypothetical protein
MLDGQDGATLPSDGTRRRDGDAVIGRDKTSATLVTGQDDVKRANEQANKRTSSLANKQTSERANKRTS